MCNDPLSAYRSIERHANANAKVKNLGTFFLLLRTKDKKLKLNKKIFNYMIVLSKYYKWGNKFGIQL